MAWYENQPCLVCKKPIGKLHFWSDKPKLVDRKGDSVDWKKKSDTEIATLLKDHSTVCYNCYCEKLEDLLKILGQTAA